jgi:hypothetical protein
MANPNIANWNRRKLIQFIEDNFDQAKSGGISFLFSEDGTLGWLNQSGYPVQFSNQGLSGSGTVDYYQLDGVEKTELPISVPVNSLFEVSASGVEPPFYVSFRVR